MLGMLDKKDKLAALIVGGPKEESEGPEDMDMSGEAKKDAARALLSAIERKDIKALVEAMETMMQVCEYSEEESED
jgi:hypothetical protein